MEQSCFKIHSVKDNKKLIKFLNSTRKELEKFFNIKIRPVSVFLLDSRDQIDQIRQEKTESWLVGWTRGNSIFILNPQKFAKESSHKDTKDFWRVLKHEYTHIAIKKFCGHDKPRWLHEGLCCYLAKQIKRKPTKNEALKVFKYYQKGDSQIYTIGYFWVKFLIEKFSKKKLLGLLKGTDNQINEEQFARKFYQIYKIHFNKKGLTKLLNKS